MRDNTQPTQINCAQPHLKLIDNNVQLFKGYLSYKFRSRPIPPFIFEQSLIGPTTDKTPPKNRTKKQHAIILNFNKKQRKYK